MACLPENTVASGLPRNALFPSATTTMIHSTSNLTKVLLYMSSIHIYRLQASRILYDTRDLDPYSKVVAIMRILVTSTFSLRRLGDRGGKI